MYGCLVIILVMIMKVMSCNNINKYVNVIIINNEIVIIYVNK